MKLYGLENSLKNKTDPKLLSAISDNITLIDAADGISFGAGSGHMVALATGLDAKGLIDLVMKSGISHIIQHTTTKFAREIHIAAVLMENPDIFLSASSTHVLSKQIQKNEFEITFRESKVRERTMKEILHFLRKIPCGDMIKDSVRIMADELFTNAIYNAPTDPSGRHIYAHYPRTQTVELDPSQFAKINLSFDDENLMVACEDPFGSLTKERFFDILQSCYAQGDLTSVNMGAGGAGLGCRMLLESSVEFYVVSKKGFKTFFGCCVPLGQSGRDAEAVEKNIHFVFY